MAASVSDINLYEAFKHRGIDEGVRGPNVFQAPNEIVQWYHGLQYSINGKSTEPTAAYFRNVYNPTNGAIVAWLNMSPEGVIKEQHEKFPNNEHYHNLPSLPLGKWSDVAFLDYKFLAKKSGDDVDRLNNIFQWKCSNPITKGVIKKLLEAKNGSSSYPSHENRLVMTMNDEWAQTLLGGPIGTSLAWLLISHKQALGHKVIKNVSIYLDSTTKTDMVDQDHHPTIIWELEDAGGRAAAEQAAAVEVSPKGKGKGKGKRPQKGGSSARPDRYYFRNRPGGGGGSSAATTTGRFMQLIKRVLWI